MFALNPLAKDFCICYALFMQELCYSNGFISLPHSGFD